MISSRAKLFSNAAAFGGCDSLLPVVFWGRVNIVCRRIVILNFDILPRHHTQDMGVILAALLIERDGIFGNIKSAISQSVFHVHKNVRQFAIVGHNGLRHVIALAGRILAHVYLGGLGDRPTVRCSATHSCGGGGINWSGGGFRLFCRRGGLLLTGVLFLATTYEQCQGEKTEQSEHRCPFFRIHDVTFLVSVMPHAKTLYFTAIRR